MRFDEYTENPLGVPAGCRNKGRQRFLYAGDQLRSWRAEIQSLLFFMPQCRYKSRGSTKPIQRAARHHRNPQDVREVGPFSYDQAKGQSTRSESKSERIGATSPKAY